MKAKLFCTLSIIALLAAAPVLAAGNQANVRVVHASPDAPPVDILVNDTVRAFSGIGFAQITGYAPLRADIYNVKVVPAGGSQADAVIEADLNLFFNTDYTVIAVDTVANIRPIVLEDDNTPVSVVRSRVRFVHASPDAPPVDIKVTDGPYLFRNVSFTEAGDYITVPEGIYNLEVRVAGTDIVALELPAVMLDGGTTYTAFAFGLVSGSPALEAALQVDSRNPAVTRSNGRRGLPRR